MKIPQYAYEYLKHSIAKIYKTSDLTESLKSSAKEDKALAAIMREHFDDDFVRCAEFIKKNSNIRTRVLADINVVEARVSAYFDVRKEVTCDDINEFIDNEFSFLHVGSLDYAILNVEHADVQYAYEMRDLQTLSLAA